MSIGANECIRRQSLPQYLLPETTPVGLRSHWPLRLFADNHAPQRVGIIPNDLDEKLAIDVGRRTAFFDMLGSYRLWLGNTPEAIEHFEKARALVVPESGDKGPLGKPRLMNWGWRF